VKLARGSSLLLAEQREGSLEHQVRVVKTLREALASWKSSARTSPIFRIEDVLAESPDVCAFDGNWDLLFLGPVDPSRLESFLEKGMMFWITLGLFNAVIATRSRNSKRSLPRLQQWASHNQIASEHWTVLDGIITSTTTSPLPSRPAVSSASLESRLLKLPSDTTDAQDEFRILMATALARSASHLPATHPISLHLEAISKLLPESIPTEPSSASAALTEINSALSSLNSQSLSGVSPIVETDCSFRTHSLLGIGIPSLALLNIVNFLHETLAQARLAQRISLFVKSHKTFSFVKIESFSDKRWKHHYLDEVSLEPKDQEAEIVPVIPFFSGRDGFKATENTISAPLGTISSCSSRKWTLRTLTHETIHSIVGSCLTALLPKNEDEGNRVLELLNNQRTPATLYEDVQLLLIHIFDDLDKAIHSDYPHVDDPPQIWNWSHLEDLIFTLRHEVEETMVHAFDYLYFYRGAAESYVSTVWNSLDSIPALARRVPHFVMRTLAATAIPYLDRVGSPETAVRRRMCKLLEQIGATNGRLGSYRHLALEFLTNRWSDHYERELTARIWTANFVRSFLYLPELERQLGEIHVTSASGSGTRGRHRGISSTGVSYPHKAMCFGNTDYIADPMGFVSAFATDKCDAARSAWLLTTLAFGAVQNDKSTS
jgi:hypothetical protein